MKALVDDKIPFIKGEIEKLVDKVVYKKGDLIDRSDVHDADILVVRTRTICNERLLSGSRVKLVVTATIGYDHLDTSYFEQSGIRWTNCPGCNASSVRQYVHNSLFSIGKLSKGLVAGVVGVGHVGSLVADDLECAGMRVLRCDPPKGEPFTLEDIAKAADIITFHTPLTRSGDCPTYHLAGHAFFNMLERKPVVINSSRGGVVDESALLKSYAGGMVSAMIIDTWESEPDINLELLDKAVIATPHVAGYSADGKANATKMSLNAICGFLGKPMNLDIFPPSVPEDYSYGKETSGCLRLYDPRVDSSKLKHNPERFEWFRGNYPLRREKTSRLE